MMTAQIRRFVPRWAVQEGLESPLEDVSNTAWARFVAILNTQGISAISDSGGLGAYDIRPRRLVELGYASGLKYVRSSKGRQVHTCEFTLPWTQARFLDDPMAQYAAFSKSISLYYKDLMCGKLPKLADASVSFALVVLHRGGTGALQAYPDLFPGTQALATAARGIF